MNKIRYSIPARILELLYSDDNFFNDVLKIKKLSSHNKFPKNDEWRDASGFNLSFALAGYSSEDIVVEVENRVLIIRGMGLDSIEPSLPEVKNNEDPYFDYVKETKPRIHIGSISRGIARRKFCVKYLISEEFDLDKIEAKMDNGLLHIIIPEQGQFCIKNIEIKSGR